MGWDISLDKVDQIIIFLGHEFSEPALPGVIQVEGRHGLPPNLFNLLVQHPSYSQAIGIRLAVPAHVKDGSSWRRIFSISKIGWGVGGTDHAC
jgi:hypothetical protein